ncbi:GlxA family transcriptional regulator [uncultured Roseibium sp.]|uniref:GlxA family transcriptional regulator n=1 Tax=uncultured Roseibium sp. TaxID=1936171 RepID=UPI00261A7E8E|nr:GlxA family transcriptional regulator [uncultured Roseibium sp.]
MSDERDDPVHIVLLVTPHFNVSATTSFVDPFRVANYLTGTTTFSWDFVSETGGLIPSSSGLSVQTKSLADIGIGNPALVVVSTSWTPERHYTDVIVGTLKKWMRAGVTVGALDTGAFVLAKSGLLSGKTATVHYEHIDALIEIAPKTTVSENLFTLDERVFTCCGGSASTDIALHFLRSYCGVSLANAASRYLFHHEVRGEGSTQNPKGTEPTGYATPGTVRRAIDLMEAHLEEPLPIPVICQRLGVSQRQLSRLFGQYVRRSPVEYYRDIRLDRARGLVTQTEMKLSEVAAASGFNSQVHFSRAYKQRFGLAPGADRIEGRVPFEFRAWPMHSPKARSDMDG